MLDPLKSRATLKVYSTLLYHRRVVKLNFFSCTKYMQLSLKVFVTWHIKFSLCTQEEPVVGASFNGSMSPPMPDERDLLIERLMREINELKQELQSVKAEVILNAHLCAVQVFPHVSQGLSSVIYQQELTLLSAGCNDD